MLCLNRWSRIAAAVCLVLLQGRSLRAQEAIKWRSDFNTALREAGDKKRPLFLDVSTTGCPACVNLDVNTFRDAALVKMLNEGFIPVKVDGGINTIMVQGKPIGAFPTMVFIGHENTLLGLQEGFVEADNLKQQLQKVLTTFKPAVKNPPPAVPNQGAPAPPPNQNPVPVPPTNAAQGQLAKRMLPPFQADAKIGPITEANNNVWPGVRDNRPASKFGPQFAQPFEERFFRARHLLLLAQEDYQRQQWIACLEHCKTLTLLYPDLQESVDAHHLASRIRSNPDLLERLGRDLADSLAEVYWYQAHGKLRENQASLAIPYLEKIVQTCPGTRYAPAAQEYLHRLGTSAASARK